ncbi:MAG: lytic transglycosylase domain-containing protein [Acetobacteraceae bacterium]
MPAPLLACMSAVAAFYQLPPAALPAIHAAENGRAGIVRHNRNGSDDLGAMQINTIWLPMLSAGTGLPQDRLRDALIRQDCFNVAVAGAILRIYLHEAGDNLVRAVGYYHSHTPSLRVAYERRVFSSLRGAVSFRSSRTRRGRGHSVPSSAE